MAALTLVQSGSRFHRDHTGRIQPDRPYHNLNLQHPPCSRRDADFDFRVHFNLRKLPSLLSREEGAEGHPYNRSNIHHNGMRSKIARSSHWEVRNH